MQIFYNKSLNRKKAPVYSNEIGVSSSCEIPCYSSAPGQGSRGLLEY